MATQTFEKAMQQLEKIVEELEAGEMPLETSLKKFEEAVRLSRFCSEKLDESEKKIALLLKTPDGGLKEEPVDEEP
jgi:exodeoxyribonuclease VII small subunit